MIDLDYDDVDAELAGSIRRWCEDHAATTGDPLADHDANAAAGIPAGHWQALADLGVLGLGTPEGGGGVTTIAAAMEALGHGDVPGPLVATFLATQLLDEPGRAPVVAGSALVAAGSPALLPWAPVADVFVEIDGADVYLCELDGAVEEVRTLGGEPWGRCSLRRTASLGDAGRALAVADVALAAYLVGEAKQMLDAAVAYAADRVQFRKPIGSFQAVAYPLGDCARRVMAARSLARMAAHALDSSDSGEAAARAAAATARLSATAAALDTAYQVHQTYGALGFTLEGPVGRRSSRVRQLSLLPPGPAHARGLVLAGHGL